MGRREDGHPPRLEGIHPPGWGEGVWEAGVVGHPPRLEGILPPGWREGSRRAWWRVVGRVEGVVWRVEGVPGRVEQTGSVDSE